MKNESLLCFCATRFTAVILLTIVKELTRSFFDPRFAYDQPLSSCFYVNNRRRGNHA